MKLEPEALEQIARIVRDIAVVPVERRHWDYDTIGAYHGCTGDHVRQHIACLPDFPKQIKATKNARPKFIAGEVMEWFEARKV